MNKKYKIFKNLIKIQILKYKICKLFCFNFQIISLFFQYFEIKGNYFIKKEISLKKYLLK